MTSNALRKGLLGLMLFAAAGLAAVPAQAGVLTGSATFSLFKPNGVTGNALDNATLTDTVALTTGIHTNDGEPGGVFDTNIGGFMLPGPVSTEVGEFIEFSGNTVSLRLRAGNDAGGIRTTGYGAGAHYLITGLGLDVLGELITGIDPLSYVISGLNSPTTPGSFISFDVATQALRIDLDNLVFTNPLPGLGTNTVRADISFSLLSAPCTGPNCGQNNAPEPASLGLVLAALAALPRLRRRAAAA